MTTKKELRAVLDEAIELADKRRLEVGAARRALTAMTVDRDLRKSEATRNAADLFAERTKNAELLAANSELTELVTELRRDITDLASQVSRVGRNLDTESIDRVIAHNRACNAEAELADAQRDLGECRDEIGDLRRELESTKRQANHDWDAIKRSVEEAHAITAVGDRVLAALVKRDPNARRGRPARDWAAVTADYRTEGDNA